MPWRRAGSHAMSQRSGMQEFEVVAGLMICKDLLGLLFTDQGVVILCLTWSLAGSPFDAAGPVADLTAAPVYSPKEADVTFVMPVAKRARNRLQFNWPKMRGKPGEHMFPYVALELNAAIRGMAGTSRY